MGEQSLPGLRFYPTEEELVSFYLHNKLEASSTVQSETNQLINRVIPELLIYEFNPWDLPEVSGELCRGDPEQWFFFIPRQERGGRANRLTSTGYWKATGSPSYVYSSANYRTIGLKRTMVYYTGRAPSGTKTPWKMNEYKAIIQPPTPTPATAPTLNTPMLRQEYSLCRVYKQPKTMRAFDRRPIANYPTPPLIPLPLTIPPLVQQGGNGDGTVEATHDHARPVIPFLSFDDSLTFIRDDHHVPIPLNYQVADFGINDDEDGSCSVMDWDQVVL